MIPLQYLLEEEARLRIYCDMDGVLTDFVKVMKDIGWTGSLDFRNDEVDKMWKLIDDHGGSKFWSKMPWIKGGKKLWKFIKDKDPYILTSVGQPLHSVPGRKRRIGKEQWIKRELGYKYLSNAIIVPSKRMKAEFAKDNAVLIDDEKQNIEDFIQAGGIGILHKSADTTIIKLKKIMNSWSR